MADTGAGGPSSPNGNGNGNGKNGQKASAMMRTMADNSFAMIFARYMMPIILGVIGWLMVDKMASLDKKVDNLWEAVKSSRELSSSTHEQMQVLSSRMEDRAAVQASQLADHETRIRGLEQRQHP